MEDEDVVASLAGTIDRVNKLVSVRAVRGRYNPEVGDLIIGRITEVHIVRSLLRDFGLIMSVRLGRSGGRWMRTLDRTPYSCSHQSTCLAVSNGTFTALSVYITVKRGILTRC